MMGYDINHIIYFIKAIKYDKQSQQYYENLKFDIFQEEIGFRKLSNENAT